MYSIEEVEVAIAAAREVIDSRALDTERYIRGYNDCFAFILEYERALRGSNSLSKEITLSYNDPEEFMLQIHEQLGYTNLLKFALAMKFKPVKNRRPVQGDISFDMSHGKASAMVANSSHWFSTDEIKGGTRPRRRLLKVEIYLDMHVRPTYLGD